MARTTRLIGIVAALSFVSWGCGGGAASVAEPSTNRGIYDNTDLDASGSGQRASAGQREAAGLIDVVEAGDTVYALTTNGLVIADGAALADPAQRSHVMVGAGAQRLAVAGQRVYVAAGTNGLRIIDQAGGDLPTVTGTWAPSSGAVELVSVEGPLALVGLGGQGVAVVDTTDAAKPVEVSRVPELRNAADLVLSNRWAFVLTDKLNVLDLSTPDKPRAATKVDLRDKPLALVLRGERLLIVGAKSYHLLDIGKPEAPRVLATLTQAELLRALPVGEVKGRSEVRAVWTAAQAAVLRDGRVYLLDIDDTAIRGAKTLDALGAATSLLWAGESPRLVDATGDLITVDLTAALPKEAARASLLQSVAAADGSATSGELADPLTVDSAGGAEAEPTLPDSATEPLPGSVPTPLEPGQATSL